MNSEHQNNGDTLDSLEQQASRGKKKGKFMDDRGRLFGLFNLIDCVAIFALILLIGGFYFKNNVLEATGGGSKDVGIEVTILMEIVPPYLADAIQVGDELFDHDHATGGAIGIITDKQVMEPEALISFQDATYDYVSSEEGVNVLLTVQGKGTYTSGRYSFNRVYELGINAARYFQSKYVLFIGTVIDINTFELATTSTTSNTDT